MSGVMLLCSIQSKIGMRQVYALQRQLCMPLSTMVSTPETSKTPLARVAVMSTSCALCGPSKCNPCGQETALFADTFSGKHIWHLHACEFHAFGNFGHPCWWRLVVLNQ